MLTKRADKCCNGGNQHKFRPRYTEESLLDMAQFSTIRIQNRNLLIKRVYVGDVCEWCGRTVKMKT